jgi:hypothetical protein
MPDFEERKNEYQRYEYILKKETSGGFMASTGYKKPVRHLTGVERSRDMTTR